MITPEIKASLRNMAENAGWFADDIIQGMEGDTASAAMLFLASLFVCMGRLGMPREDLEHKTLLEVSLILFNQITPGEFKEPVS